MFPLRLWFHIWICFFFENGLSFKRFPPLRCWFIYVKFFIILFTTVSNNSYWDYMHFFSLCFVYVCWDTLVLLFLEEVLLICILKKKSIFNFFFAYEISFGKVQEWGVWEVFFFCLFVCLFFFFVFLVWIGESSFQKWGHI